MPAQTAKQRMNLSLIGTSAIPCMKGKLICLITETLFFVGCMLPAYSKCWDEDIIPKWYATMCIVLVVITLSLLYPEKTKGILVEWKSVLPYSAGFGILFQTCTVIHDLNILPISILEFGIGGTYGNPSCFAVTICLLYPLTLRLGGDKPFSNKEKLIFRRIWNVSFSLISLFLLICAHSRTGIIVFVFFMTILFYIFVLNKTTLSKVAIALLFVVIALFCSSSYKQNSTKGRSFILMRTAELISKKPFTGYGFGSFEKTYMRYQGEYFKLHPESKYVQLADSIKHPLNEFVKLWIEFGVVAPIFLLLFIIIPLLVFRNNLKIVMIETCLFLFSMFSYPFILPLPTIILFSVPVVLAMYFFKSERIIKTVVISFVITMALWLFGAFYIDNLLSSATFYSTHQKHNRALLKYSQLNNLFCLPCLNKLYLSRYKVYSYNYSRELFTTSNFAEALQMITKTEQINTNFDTQLLIADICYNMNEYNSAIKAYNVAFDMCPVRFSPLEGLLNCYAKQKNHLLEKQTARIILVKSIKVNSEDVDRIRNKAFLILHK